MQKIEKSLAEVTALSIAEVIRVLRKESGAEFQYILAVFAPNDDKPEPGTECITVSSIKECEMIKRTLREMSEGEIKNA